MLYIIQQTERIPNNPPRMGVKSYTASNHPSTPRHIESRITNVLWQKMSIRSLKIDLIKTKIYIERDIMEFQY